MRRTGAILIHDPYYIELLENVFDLCRYHHILIRSPHGQACAYKEMGRCPAPCDGSVSLVAYRDQVARSIAFTRQPIEMFRQAIEEAMRIASENLAFEEAMRLRKILDAIVPSKVRPFHWVRSLEALSLVSIQTSERAGWLRLFLIRGGWVAPVVDLAVEAPQEQIEAVIERLRNSAQPRPEDFCESALENLGLVCWHLFQPKSARCRGEFLRTGELDASMLRLALRRVAKTSEAEAEALGDDQAIEPAAPFDR